MSLRSKDDGNIIDKQVRAVKSDFASQAVAQELPGVTEGKNPNSRGLT